MMGDGGEGGLAMLEIFSLKSVLCASLECRQEYYTLRAGGNAIA